MQINCRDCGVKTDWMKDPELDPNEIVCGDCFDKLLAKIDERKRRLNQ